MPLPPSIDDGSIYRVIGLSAGALNASLVPAMDVSQYTWINLQIKNNAYSGTLTFYGSCDPVALSDPASNAWIPVALYSMADRGGIGSTSHTSATNLILGGPATFSFFQVLMTGYTSGQAQAALELRKEGMPGFQLVTFSVLLLDSLSARIGMTNNDGLDNVAIASGHAADTVIGPSQGFLSHVLVTATNTHEMDIYDNSSSGSGVIIGVVPASAAVGTIIECKSPCYNGITVKGNANNPGVTAFFVVF